MPVDLRDLVTMHPLPFRAIRKDDGQHVVVDATGSPVATVHGDWAHRTAVTIASALNVGEHSAEELPRLREVAEAHEDCEDNLDDARRERKDAEEETKDERSKREEAERKVDELEDLVNRRDSKIVSLEDEAERLREEVERLRAEVGDAA